MNMQAQALSASRVHAACGPEVREFTWAGSSMDFEFRPDASPEGAPAAESMPLITRDLALYAQSGLPEALSSLVADRAQQAIVASRSYCHANGFTKLVLDESASGKLRLHVWEPGVDAEENIHEHRWCFSSVVLTGALRSEIWADAYEYCAPEFNEFVYQVAGGKATRRPVGRTRLSRVRSAERVAGESYYMLPGVLHRVTGASGVTSTLVFTTPPSRSWNRMLSDDGVRPDVRRRPIKPSDVRRLAELVLATRNAGGADAHRD